MTRRDRKGASSAAPATGGVEESGAPAPPVAGRRQLLVHLFVCGTCIIVAEVAAFRLLAPYFGSTQFITTNVLGVVLAALAAGYWLGGRLADRRPDASTLYFVTALGGAGLAALPWVATPVLRAAGPALGHQNASLFLGTLAAMVVLFALPILLVGMVSPFTIRLLSQGDRVAGSRSGAVFALSTLGSILGAYLPALLLIPMLGTRGTIHVAGAAVLVSSGVGLLRARRLAGAGALVAAVAGAASIAAPVPLKGGPGVLAEKETEYHLVRVLRDARQGRTYLELNEGLSFHSVWYDDGRAAPGVWGFLQLLPDAIVRARGATPAASDAGTKPPMRVCIVGLAAGTVATQLTRAYGDRFDLRIDGVEIDPEIVELGRRYFALDERCLRVFLEDGRTFLQRTTEKYDLILGDAYRQPYIPAHLVTQEFFELARARLAPGGVCAVNVGALGADAPVLLGIQNALAAAFPGAALERFAVENADVPFVNWVCMASPTPLRDAWAAIDAPALQAHRDLALASWSRFALDPTAPTFTDDRAPVEWYTDLSLMRFVSR